MTEAQLKSAITAPRPFFGVSPQGDVLARYVPYGPVLRWQRNQMVPLPVQGGDLCWLIHAAAEEGRALSDGEDGQAGR